MKENSFNKAWIPAILNSITDAVVVVDAQWRIRLVNSAFTALLGYTSEEVASSPLVSLYAHPESFEKLGEDKIQEEAQQSVCEIQYKNKAGNVVLGETLDKPVQNQEGELLGFLRSIRIISDSKARGKDIASHDSPLPHTQEMETVAALAGRIVHQLNNILGIIIGNADMALEDIPDENPAKESISDLLEASGQANNLLKQLLDLTRHPKKNSAP